MKRKVIRQGPSSYMISLPKEWITQQEVKKGQELNLFIKGERILVSVEEFTSDKDTIDFYLNEYNFEEIFKYYSEGFSGIEIHFNSEKEFKKIKQIIDSLLGADIYDRDKLKANILFSDLKIELDTNKLITKILLIIKWQVQSLVKELKTKKIRSKEEILEISLEVYSKISLLLRNIYAKKRAGREFLGYSSSLEYFRNIQKAIIFFYETPKLELLRLANISLLDSLVDLFVHLIDIYSIPNTPKKLSSLFGEIDNIKKNIQPNKVYSALDVLEKEIIFGLEGFCLSMQHFLDVGKNNSPV